MTGLSILALNWRDIENPEAGGAEVHIHEILRWLARQGHTVTLLSSSFAGCTPDAVIDGVRVLRRGRWFNANFTLPMAYLRELRREKFDVVLEDINKIPFYTPCFIKAPILAIVPHLFGTTVFQEASFPFAMYVYFYELFIPAIYKNTQFMAISESTKRDLVGRGIKPEKISVVECGLDHNLYRESGVARDPKLVLYLGRLRKYKCVHLLIKAMTKVRDSVPGARLVIIGDGPYKAELERLATALGLSDVVEFKGHVSSNEKVKLLCQAAVMANPSPKEGWGLTVVEANACGVPVVASRSPGLVDSIRDGETGFLVEHGNVEQLAQKMVEILLNEELRKRLSRGAIQWASRFTWEGCAQKTAELIEELMPPREELSGSRK